MVMYPKVIVKKTTSVSPACINPVLDERIVIDGSPTITSADDLTFNIADFTGTGNSIIIFKTSVDLLALGNFNDWIQATAIINITTPDNEGMKFGIGIANENVDLNNPASFAGNSIAVNSSVNLDPGGNSMIVVNTDFSDDDITANYNNAPAVSNGFHFGIGIKRDGSNFRSTISAPGLKPSLNYFEPSILTMPIFNEMYIYIFISNGESGSVKTFNFTLSYDPTLQRDARPNVAGPCGNAPNVALAGVATPTIKTGQQINYTPAGRTCLDDGGEQKGRSAKNSIFMDGPNSNGIEIGSPYTGGKINNGSINITYGTETVSVDADYWTFPAIGLMYNLGGYDQGFQLTWDDSAGADNDIFEFCDQCNLGNLSGFSDWRIANIQEAQALFILDANQGSGPSYPSNAAQQPFLKLMTANVWSSTTDVANTARAYTFLDDGRVQRRNKTAGGSNFGVFLVRDLPSDAE